MDEYSWTEDASAVDFAELSELYRIAPLGIKPPDALKTVFGHSMFVCFAYAGDVLYANPGTEGFYRGLGFLHMNTAMAIWRDPARAIESGLLSPES